MKDEGRRTGVNFSLCYFMFLVKGKFEGLKSNCENTADRMKMFRTNNTFYYGAVPCISLQGELNNST